MVTLRGCLLLFLALTVANAADKQKKIDISRRTELENEDNEDAYYEDRPTGDEPVTPLPSKFCEDKKDGFYADVPSKCKCFHYCQTWKLPYGERKVDWRFHCPGSTVFSQEHLSCVPEDIFKDCKKSSNWFDKDQIIPGFPPTDDHKPTIPELPGGPHLPKPDDPHVPKPDQPHKPKPTTESPETPEESEPIPEIPEESEPIPEIPPIDSDIKPERPQRPKPTTENPLGGSKPIPGLPGDINPIIPDLPIPGFPNPTDFLSVVPSLEANRGQFSDDTVEIRNPELLPPLPPIHSSRFPTLEFRQNPILLNPFHSPLPYSETYKGFGNIQPLNLQYLTRPDMKKKTERNQETKILENIPKTKHSELVGFLPHYPPYIIKDLEKPLEKSDKPLKDEEKMSYEVKRKDESQPSPLPLLPLIGLLKADPELGKDINTKGGKLSTRSKEDINNIWDYSFAHEPLETPSRISLFESSPVYHTPVAIFFHRLIDENSFESRVIGKRAT